ncbi:MAG TPA: SIS domain-containing protein [Nocardioidaceae bacterium]|nr:SIS domain-containing protein [Nocardioidaceae bacterium]
MTFLDQELAEQPAAAARLLEAVVPDLDRLAAAVRGPADRPVHGVVIAARGTSDNAARYAQYLWGMRHGLPVALATPSLHSVYHRSLDLTGHSVVAVSQSGASPDVVGVVARARDAGRPTLAITNDADSDLARAAAQVLALNAGPERSVAATKTYTTSLLAVALVSVALGGDHAAELDEVRRVPAALEASVRTAQGVDAAARLLVPHHRAVCVGRGVNLATAHEVALKLTELTGTLVAPFSPADLRHGPIAAVGPDVPVVLVVPDEEATASVLDLLPELRRRRAPVVLLGPPTGDGASATRAGEEEPSAEPQAVVSLPETAALPGWLTPLTAVVTGQLLARRVAELRGVDIDRPGDLSKVTRTD